MQRISFRKVFPICMPLVVCIMAVGCASTPMQVSLLREEVAFREYPVLVVEDFESAVGEVVPKEVVRFFPDRVISHIERDHPGLFQEVRRQSQGTGDELVVRGVFTKYRKGSKLARAILIGLGSAKLEADVYFVDGATDSELCRGKVDLLWAMGGGIGASEGIEDLVDQAAKQIADFVAEQKEKMAGLGHQIYVSQAIKLKKGVY